jgi:hypothetical protein
VHVREAGGAQDVRGEVPARQVDETIRPGRRAAPLYGGGISHSGWVGMEGFFAACAESEDPESPVTLSVPRIIGVRPIKIRSGHGPADKTNNTFFNTITVSPLYTFGPWTGPAPELLLNHVRKGSYWLQEPGMYVAPDSPVRGGFFATGLPELATGTEPAEVGLGEAAAVIPQDRIESLALSLQRAVHGPQAGSELP